MTSTSPTQPTGSVRDGNSAPINLRTFKDPMPDLEGRVILVTGGTGSFGKSFVRYVLQHFNPRKIIIFSRDELKQFEMQGDTFFREHEDKLRYFIGDVRDCDRLEMAMRGVHFVIHAAALKHVPAAEYNPFECIRTNVHGAENVVKAAIRADVEKVIALSTDKAANPINLYGASKLASDKIFVAANNLSAGKTAFAVVRYGNVIGSRGSVIPFFEKLIQNGATELPITASEMTRFWITVEQGVNFVLSSLAMMHRGEIFVPQIPSMAILSLAEAMAPDLPTKIVGIRPGEKLHEVMITEDDARNTLKLADRYVIAPAFPFWSDDLYSNYGSSPIEAGFSYSSNQNDEWLSVDELRNILASTDIEQY